MTPEEIAKKFDRRAIAGALEIISVLREDDTIEARKLESVSR